MTTKIDQLTEEQIRAIPSFVDKYVGIGLNTDRFTTEQARGFATRLYKFLGKEPPVVIVMDGPIHAWIAICILSQKNQVREQVWNQVGNQVWNQVRNQVENQVWEQVENQVGNQVWNQVWNQVGNQVENQVRNQVRKQVREQVRNQVRNQVENQVRNQVEGFVWPYLDGHLWASYLSWIKINEFIGVKSNPDYSA